MQSMTGFGRGYASRDGREMTLELKSVNHRFLDIAFRMPRSLSFLEETLRGWLKEKGVVRGHVDISITYANTRSDARRLTVDTGRLVTMAEAIKGLGNLKTELREPSIAELLTLSEAVTVTEAPEEEAALLELTKECFDTAAASLLEMRRKEGENLTVDLLERLEEFDRIRGSIARKAPQVPLAFQKRLTARLQELNIPAADPARVAQEVAMMADRCAIDEELSRLESHIAQFRAALQVEGEAGKRLDFLLQEMNRETNTIASKANDLDISNAAVEGKCILEKLREQAANVA